MHRLEQEICAVLVLPKLGIAFRGVTPLVGDPRALKLAVYQLLASFIEEDIRTMERHGGFVLASPLSSSP